MPDGFPLKFVGVLGLLVLAMFGSFWLMWNYSLEVGLSYSVFSIGLLVVAIAIIVFYRRRS